MATMGGRFVSAFLMALWVGGVLGSPWQTWGVYENFDETVELILSWSHKVGFIHLENGMGFPADEVVTPPMEGAFCRAKEGQNYTVVLLSADVTGDVQTGRQRALYIVGNVPSDPTQEGGIIKLPYIPPKWKKGRVHVAALLEQTTPYIPRFLPDDEWPYNCTTNNGTVEIENIECAPGKAAWPACSLTVWKHDDACVAWQQLPKYMQREALHDNNLYRNDFNLTRFAGTNNLTMVGVKWFSMSEAGDLDTPADVLPSNPDLKSSLHIPPYDGPSSAAAGTSMLGVTTASADHVEDMSLQEGDTPRIPSVTGAQITCKRTSTEKNDALSEVTTKSAVLLPFN